MEAVIDKVMADEQNTVRKMTEEMLGNSRKSDERTRQDKVL